MLLLKELDKILHEHVFGHRDEIACHQVLGHDLAETLRYDVARIVAVADFDSNRAAKGKQFIENYYTKKNR